MKVVTLCLLVAAVAGGAEGVLAPPERQYKILLLLPMSFRSHRTIFMSLAEALAERGHKVVMLTNHPKSSSHPNIDEVTHGLEYINDENINMFNDRKQGYKIMRESIVRLARDLYDVPVVKELYLRRKDFDLIVVSSLFNEISAHFPDLPPLLDLERNMSMMFVNTHFSVGMPVPLLPSQVEVGAIHCRPANPLSQELESWITGAGSPGVIYFSLGSFTKFTNIPVQYRDVFVQAFRRLPQRVIWKYDGDLEDVPDNVMIRKWLPQQDILGHNNVKVFISHCGLLSMQEAIYHGTPVLAVPLFADQPSNSHFLTTSELGLSLVWEELTADKIVNALNDIINDPKYQENVLRMSMQLRDTLMTPRELAVFWTEYVIRHRGAPQLRSPAAQLSWVEFLMLDVIFLLYLVIFVLCLALRRILKVVSAKVSGSVGIKKKY
ncbi:UDP-glucosyltransferase 2 isoform X2 [Cherax quadricarinatus]|uniref:UDP-glucosyltransferase 2 isoform X2 n=1 Tax=Cherax quadricarinatus TaxID=27406 RepID=UPI00387E7401